LRFLIANICSIIGLNTFTSPRPNFHAERRSTLVRWTLAKTRSRKVVGLMVELMLLFSQYLAASKFQRTYNALLEDLSQKPDSLPKRITWNGQERTQELAQIVTKHDLPSDSIVQMGLSYLKQQLRDGVQINSLLGLNNSLNHSKLVFNENFLSSPCQVTRHKIGARIIGSRYQKLITVHGHLSPVYCIVFDRPGERFVTGGDDNIVKIWCAKTGWLIHTLRPHQTLNNHFRPPQVGVIVDVTISQDNSVLATCSSDHTIRIWDFETFEMLSYINVRKHIHSIRISPSPVESNKCLVVACADARTRVYLWNRKIQRYDKTPIVLESGTLQKDASLYCCFNKTGTKFMVLTCNTDCWHRWHCISF
jgi:WD40 repeat protein